MKTLTSAKRQFVEETAKTCEQMFGFSRMAGRMWAVLLITDQDYLSRNNFV